MKRVFNFFAAAAIGLPLVFNSCAKDDTAKALEVDMTKTGSCKVTLLANLDETAATQKYSAAPITVDNIVAYVPYVTLNSAAGGTYLIPKADISYSTSTGVLEINNVPTVNAGIQLTIQIIPASGTCMRSILVGGTYQNTSVPGRWSYGSNITAYVLPGGTDLLSSRIMSFTPDVAAGSNVY